MARPDQGHLDATALAKLAGLQLRVKAVVEGTLAGIHPSPRYGSSVEFAEHKEYAPGDDLRRLDWKALGKFDRYYVKRFEDETDLKAYLVLDCSGSMSYGEPLSKLEYGSVLLASLAFFLMRQGDQPALLAFADEVRSYLPPRARSSHMAELLSALQSLDPGGGTDLALAIGRLTEVMQHRSLVVLVSDLFDSERSLALLRHLRARRNMVVLFHLLHPDELEFPFSRVTLFESLESDARVLVDPGGIRAAYLRQMERFLEGAALTCREGEVEYHRVSAAAPLDRVLLRFLSDGRSARSAAARWGHR